MSIVGRIGRKTGYIAKESVKRDENNMDDLDDFWDSFEVGRENNKKRMDQRVMMSDMDVELQEDESYIKKKEMDSSPLFLAVTATTNDNIYSDEEITFKDGHQYILQAREDVNITPTSALKNHYGNEQQSSKKEKENSTPNTILSDRDVPSLNVKVDKDLRKRLLFSHEQKEPTISIEHKRIRNKTKIDMSKNDKQAKKIRNERDKTRSITQQQKEKDEEDEVIKPKISDSMKNVISGTSRRGRNIVKPLQWWKNERIVYQMEDSHDAFASKTMNIVKAKLENTTDKSKLTKEILNKKMKDKGFKEINSPEIEAIDVVDGKLKMMDLIRTVNMVDFKAVNGKNFKLYKAFQTDTFDCGMLLVPKNEEKPIKNTKKNDLLFYIMNGSVEVTVHESVVPLKTGGHFYIPQGNEYRIANYYQQDARLFYVIVKKS